MAQCTAKSKRSQKQCKKSAVRGFTVCEIHGGKTPTGIALPQTTSGRYSKNLPTRFLSRYETSLKDPEILALSDDVALLDARLEDLLSKVDTGETGETWRALMDAVQEFEKSERAAQSGGNQSGGKRAGGNQAEHRLNREEAMRTIIVLCQAGMADYAAWAEVGKTLEQRRKTAETETKRRLSMRTMISEDRALLMQSAILDIIRRNVTDRNTLSSISRDFGKLALGGDGAGA